MHSFGQFFGLDLITRVIKRKGSYFGQIFGGTTSSSTTLCADRAALLYSNLRGSHGLESLDPAWTSLLEPDHTGFRGLTCVAVVRCTCRPAQFAAGGFRIITGRVDPSTNEELYETQDSDVVCFELLKTDDLGVHAPVMTNEFTGAFTARTGRRISTRRSASPASCRDGPPPPPPPPPPLAVPRRTTTTARATSVCTSRSRSCRRLFEIAS